MRRYILKKDNQFCKWIQWTGGVLPAIVFVTEEENATIYDEEYMSDMVHKNLDKSRKDAISDKYPGIEFIEVDVMTAEEQQALKQVSIVHEFVVTKLKELEKTVDSPESFELAVETTKSILNELFNIIDELPDKEVQDTTE